MGGEDGEVISFAADARNTEIFSPRKWKRNFHGCIRPVGLVCRSLFADRDLI